MKITIKARLSFLCLFLSVLMIVIGLIGLRNSASSVGRFKVN